MAHPVESTEAVSVPQVGHQIEHPSDHSERDTVGVPVLSGQPSARMMCADWIVQ